MKLKVHISDFKKMFFMKNHLVPVLINSRDSRTNCENKGFPIFPG